MKQAEKTYLISDAAKQVEVESHVLRYWEEELRLPIKRNELGHRYYTEEDIQQFREIREMKEQGFQLKAIRNLLLKRKEEAGRQELVKRHVVMVNKGEFMPVPEEGREAKSLKLQQLLQGMIMEAVRSNNKEVCDEIKESLLKELDYQFRLQEEREECREEVRTSREEEHYKALDELLRAAAGRPQRGFKRSRKETAEPEAAQAALFRRSLAKSLKQQENSAIGSSAEKNDTGERKGEDRQKRFCLKKGFASKKISTAK